MDQPLGGIAASEGTVRVLMVHNRYKQRGGEDVSTEVEVRVLRDRGHHVDTIEEDNARIDDLGIVRTGLRTLWSREAHRRVADALGSGSYDVMHVQNFFPLLSPSIYYAARSAGVPVVQALRNFRLLCPAATLYREGQPCTDCVGKAYPWPGVAHGCYRSSGPATAAVGLMTGGHRLIGTWDRAVDLYVAPSDFARNTFVEAGWDRHRIVVKPNAVHPDPGPGGGTGGYALFVGRLTREKGIATLLGAWERHEPSLSLRIVGDGPLRDRVAAAARRNPAISWEGERETAETYRMMQDAGVVVVPSQWFETFGRVVAESFAAGTPVVVSDRGALPELVEGTGHGAVYPATDEAALARAVDRLVAAGSELRPEARADYERRFSAKANAESLERIYDRAIEGER